MIVKRIRSCFELYLFYILRGGDVRPPIGGYTSSLPRMYVLAAEDIENNGLRTGKYLSGKANRNGCFGISGERGKAF